MFSVNYIFGGSTITYIDTYETSYGITFYKINFFAYLNNLQTSLTNTDVLSISLPEREWTDITANILEEQFWVDLGNNLALILDYIILITNITLYPIRIGGYILKNALAIIGLDVNTPNTEGGLYWLIYFSKLLTILEIPFV